MHILIVLREFYCPSRPVGGAERQALKLAQALIKQGVQVTVVTGQWDLGQSRREVIGGVAVHRHFTAWGMFNLKGLRKFGQYLYLLTLFLYLWRNRRRYDFIHSHSAKFDAFVVIIAGRWLGKKHLIRAMASGRWGDIRVMQSGTSLVGTQFMLNRYRQVDCVVALNDEVATELVAIGVPPTHIVRLPNGVETEGVAVKDDYNLGEAPQLVFVGRLHPQKGVDTLLYAFQQVVQTPAGNGCRLVLLGSGPLQAKLEQLSRELGLEQSAQFLGQVESPYPILAQSDIFVLPSLAEGMSNALLEAMAHGLPCLVSDIPGNNNLIEHGRNGLLVPPVDSQALAQAILTLLTDQPLRAKLGRQAVADIQARYSIEAVADRYQSLYRALQQELPLTGL